MGKIGRQNINDVAKSEARRTRVVFHNGARVIEKRPTGHVEEFVHPQGNVGTHQLRSIGHAAASSVVEQSRNELHRMGFVEACRCPLRHGTAVATRTLEKEFSKLPPELEDACKRDPEQPKKTARGIEIVAPCPHIKWLIQTRKAAKAELDALKRSSRVDTAAELRKEELELQREQLKAQKETNQALLAHLGVAPAAKPKKAPKAKPIAPTGPETTVDTKDLNGEDLEDFYSQVEKEDPPADVAESKPKASKPKTKRAGKKAKKAAE